MRAVWTGDARDTRPGAEPGQAIEIGKNLHLALQSRYRGSRSMVFTRPPPNPDISLADRRPRLDESRRGLRRERELKRGPLWYVRLSPDSSPVRFDNRAADR